MFFKKYNTMSTQEVTDKLVAAPKAGGNVQFCDCLKGWKFSVALDGEFAPKQLEYVVHDADKLSFTLNGQSYDAPYSAISIGKIVLFTHLVPGTSNGWHIVLDTNTRAVTAFETWFGLEVPVGGDLFGGKPTGTRQIYREVQRQYYFGYAEWAEGKGKPEKLHTTTNRIEGRGLHWKYNCGCEILTYFPSIICSTFVELDDPKDTITIAAPSDYVKINDEYYIYARYECEFDGSMTLEVIDLMDLKAVGMTFGFDENDEVNYQLHTAELTITGDAAHFENITDYGDKEVPMAGMPMTAKGARYAYRPKDMHPPMPLATVEAAIAKSQMIFEGTSIMSGANNMDFSEALVGRKFKLHYDNVKTPYPWSSANTPKNLQVTYEYDVVSKDKLKWLDEKGEWHEEKYVAFEPAKDIILFSHMLSGKEHHPNATVAIDFSNGLSTLVYARVGSWTSEWEIGATCLFGTLVDYPGVTPPFSKRHDFTTDLLGKTYSWTYSDTMSSIHVYSSPESYSWTIFQGNNSGGATWSSPCFYIKIREDAYLFQWVEENCNGSQGIMIFNPQLLHDAGFFFGASDHGLQLSIMGAYARNAGTYAVGKYFETTSVN